MLRKDYGEYRWAMTQLFARLDPVGLVRNGAPVDEYEPEINALLKWREPVTAEQISQVFAEMFGPGLGDITSADAAALADGIREIRSRFGYAPEGEGSPPN